MTEIETTIKRVFAVKTQTSSQVPEPDPIVAFLAPVLSASPEPPESRSEIATQKSNEPKERDRVVEFLASVLSLPSAARQVDSLTKMSEMAKDVMATAPGPARESKRLELVKAMKAEPLFLLLAPVMVLDDEAVRRSFTLTCDYFRCVAAICKLLRLCSGRWAQLSEADKEDVCATLVDATNVINASHDRVRRFFVLLEKEVSVCPNTPWARHYKELDCVSTKLSKDLDVQLKAWRCASRKEK